MTDLDKSGFGFQRVRTYLGPSLGWVDEYVQPTVDIKVGGIHVVQPGESLLLVEVAAAVTIQLPDVVKWMQQTGYQPATGFDRSITVKDIGGNAANFNIVVAPFGQQAIDNIQQSTVISTARAIVKFVPLNDLTGWAVQTNQGAGGGGGGGDVFKAGNNTFTGTNTFNNTITVPTVSASDNSQNAASTAYVQSLGYITGVSLLPYALIASPTFTGDPKAPTPTAGDNDTSIATTAFVQAALAAFSGGAPINAEYITSSPNATLTAERVLTNTATITWDFTTPGQAKASTAAGGGNVSNVGTPTNGQLAQWTTATTIQGIDASSLGFAPLASPTFTGDPKAPTQLQTDNDTSIATTAYVQTAVAGRQPLDADLTALSALAGTNTIYYRSAPDIWSPVTYSGLSFSGGVLSVTAGGGNVNNSGVPTVGQVAVWTDATHIQGVVAASLGFVAISDTPPATPANGSMWWESDSGTLWISYNDGNTTQWISATGGGGSGTITGTGTVGQLATWSDANAIQSVAPEVIGASKVLLQTITPSGTAAAIIPSSVLTSAYDTYEIEFSVSCTVAGALCLRVSNDGGATYQAGTNTYHYAYNYAASNASGAGNGAAATLISMGFAPDASAGVMDTGAIKIFRPSVNGLFKHFHYTAGSFGGGVFFSTYGVGAYLGGTLPVNAIQLLWLNGGTFSTNSLIKVYGIR